MPLGKRRTNILLITRERWFEVGKNNIYELIDRWLLHVLVLIELCKYEGR